MSTIVGDNWLAITGLVKLLLVVPVHDILQVTVNVLVLFQVKSGSAYQDDTDMLGFVIIIIIIIINEFHRDASLTKTSGPLALSNYYRL